MRTGLRVATAAARLQLQIIRSNPDYFVSIATAPIFATVLLAIVRQAGRDDLVAYAFMGPVLITLWRMSITVSGEIIEQDRAFGILEPAIATPSSLTAIVFARIAIVSVLGLVSFIETWLVARFAFGVDIVVEHPWVLVGTLAAATFAMSGTAVVMTAVFATGRTARIFQQTLQFPIYLLGGTVVPVSYLPDWLRPFSRLVFLSWAGDLLRASLLPATPENAFLRLLAVIALGIAAFALGGYFLERVLVRLRAQGTISFA